jgi:outer membrane protein assembly factor BamB
LVFARFFFTGLAHTHGVLHVALAALALAAPCPPPHDLVLLSAQTGAVERWLPVRDAGSVLADGRGGWYVTGRIGGCPSPVRLWHLRADGSVDPRFRTTGRVLPRLVAGGRLYVASHYEGAALDARTGRELWHVPTYTPVFALGGGRLYVGGGRGVHALDPRTGRRLPFHAPLFAPRSSVYGLAVFGRRLFVGGSLGFQGTLVALDARTGRGTGWHVRVPHGAGYTDGIGDVESLLLAGGKLFTEGHDGFGVTDARTGALDPLMNRLGGAATTFTASGSTVYFGGGIRTGFGHNLAAFDLRTGRPTGWAPRLAPYVSIGSLAADARRVLVAGSFTRSLG